jgi:hypothetical protein
MATIKSITPRLIEAAKEFNIGRETLITFLTNKGFSISGNSTTRLTAVMYEALQFEFVQRFRERTNPIKLETPNIVIENPNIIKIKNEIKLLENKITNLDSKIKTSKSSEQMVAFKKNKITYLNKIADFQQLLPKLESALARVNANNNLLINIVEIDWRDINFLKDAITVKQNGQLSHKFWVENVQPSLNAIKAHYKFNDAPKLKVEIKNNEIQRILNIEVLFYYLKILENAGSLFSEKLLSPIPIFGRYQLYTKSYYCRHLPTLFLPKCFNFLCEYTTNNLPIIPVPENTISYNGMPQIHDSFLFPLIRTKSIYWCWESAEETISKATYLFKTPSNNFELQLQMVYDYLTGDTVNKRDTLIHAHELKRVLGFVDRIYHTDFDEWKRKVRMYSGH